MATVCVVTACLMVLATVGTVIVSVLRPGNKNKPLFSGDIRVLQIGDS